MSTPTRFVLVLAVVLAGPLALRPTLAAGDPMALSQELDADYSYVGGAPTHQGNAHLGDVTEQHADIKYVLVPQVSRDWLLRFGAEWQIFSFGVPGRIPFPDTLQQVNAVIGFDAQIADQWLLRVEWQPGVYGDLRDVDFRNFDAPLVIGGSYLASADLQWVFGMLIDLRSQFPVLPAPGVRWQFAGDWTLDLILPRPRLEFEVSERLQLYVGADVKTGTFTVGDHFGRDHGIPKLDHATLDYFEGRAGAGLVWKAWPTVSLEVEGGAMLARWLDFLDKDVTLRSRPAPYLQIACRTRF